MLAVGLSILENKMNRLAANKIQTKINSFQENHFDVKGKWKEPNKQAKQNEVRTTDPSTSLWENTEGLAALSQPTVN